MKARIRKIGRGYFGQICVREYKDIKKWEAVTACCKTEAGAKRSLIAWKKRKAKQLDVGEFEI